MLFSLLKFAMDGFKGFDLASQLANLPLSCVQSRFEPVELLLLGLDGGFACHVAAVQRTSVRLGALGAPSPR